ncbi:MAG: branched-chain amino acid aminotransferase [Deltaproteobacteria bacterium]|jgi:branched-chain amino acid aminotransferase|nr:branched-chain amino acid aminotransferase [Deltaproteobacteria bacterium]
MKIRYDLLDVNKRKPAYVKLPPFGEGRTNHMFLVDYDNGEWHDPRIVPYAPLSIMPGAICLHYGQTLFEGGKAFIHPDGELYAWRFDMNAERVNKSADVIMMQNIPLDLQIEGCMRLLDVERDLCPTAPESSMYIRPLMIGTQDSLGIKASNRYIYCIMFAPVGPYYPDGFNKATTLLITSKYHRAVHGGTGNSKTGGNYAASLRPYYYAHDAGADQVLYLDAASEYIEEAGGMNHYHVLKDGTFIMPEFNDSILHSITTRTVMELAKMGKVKARFERIRVKDFVADIKNGNIIEAGALGTAAVISPNSTYLFDDGTPPLTVADGKVGKYSRQLFELYTGMQTGKIPAPEGWARKVERYLK